MHNREVNQLRAEQNQLMGILSRIPSNEYINRMSFQSRLDEVNEELDKVRNGFRDPAKTVIYFRGKPVVGSVGVYADFGVKAISQFNDIIKALAANISGLTLGERGAIPCLRENQLLITGTAIGSFGFELEENLEQLECVAEETELVEESLKKAFSILKASVESDDDLMDEVEGIDDRAITKIHDFLDTMASNEAYCAIEIDDETFSFQDYAQVERSSKRFLPNNIHEKEESYNGEFTGALPGARNFEFKLSPSNKLIHGKVGEQITDASVINHNLEIQVKITVSEKVIGNGRPRYTLLSFTRLS